MALTTPEPTLLSTVRAGYERSPAARFMLNGAGWFGYFTYLMLLALLVAPYAIDSGQHAHYWIVVGFVGLWRYSVGITHFFRAMLFLYVIYPIHQARVKAMRDKAAPSHLYFLVTSFRIDSDTAAAVYSAVIEEAVTCGYQTTIVASIVEMGDERLIRALWEKFDPPPRTRLRIVRIPGTGKRDGLAQGFRAISRDMPDGDAVVAVVDGDTLLLPGVMRKTAPFLKLFPRVGALTTNEICNVEGSYVMSEWHKLRFAQRHVHMSSMALSRRVLTLTGRMSMFRARVVTNPEFIADVQNDSLDHWRLGKFRFLTGDDKSSWYSLMRLGWDTYYVPDAGILTLESPPPNLSFFQASRQLMFRWFGNSLRQNSRALALGPRTLGWFTTYVLLDQRATMWTSLLGPTAAILGTIKYGMPILLTYMLWVGMTRLVMTCILVLAGHRIGPAFPFILYYNQVAGSMMKIYVFFHLDEQSWTRQKTTLHRDLDAFQRRFNHWSSRVMTFTAIMVFAAFVVTLI